MLLLLPPPAKGAPSIDKSLRQKHAQKRPDLFDNIAQAECNAPVVFIVVCLAVAVAVALFGVHWLLPVWPLAIARPATSKEAQATSQSTHFEKSRPLRLQSYTPVGDEHCNLLAVCRPPPARMRRPTAKTKTTQHFQNITNTPAA